MNLSAEITLKWGDGSYLFALKGKQIETLEKLCGGVGIQEIAQRLFGGRASYAMIRQTIHLGLEGGGMSPVDAADKVERFVEGRPLAAENDTSGPLATAQAVMTAAFFGYEDLDRGEARAGASPAPGAPSPNGVQP